MLGGSESINRANPTPEDRAQTVVEGRLRPNEAERGYKAGIFQRNEARAHMGMPPLPGGDVFFVEPGQGVQQLGTRAGTLKALPERDAPLHDAEVAMLQSWEARLSAEAEAIAEYVAQFMSHPGEASGVEGLIAGFNPQTKIEVTDLDGYDWDWWSKYGEAVTAELANGTVEQDEQHSDASRD